MASQQPAADTAAAELTCHECCRGLAALPKLAAECLVTFIVQTVPAAHVQSPPLALMPLYPSRSCKPSPTPGLHARGSHTGPAACADSLGLQCKHAGNNNMVSRVNSACSPVKRLSHKSQRLDWLVPCASLRRYFLAEGRICILL